MSPQTVLLRTTLTRTITIYRIIYDESVLLQNINRIITIKGHDENYTVRKSKLGLEGKTIAELKEMRDGIYERRATQPLSKQLQEGKQRLKSTPPCKKEIPPASLETSLKEAVESRRTSLDPPSDGDEDFFPEEQNWETEGSGITDEAKKIINKLYVSLGSIKAGNNSIKLNKQVFSLLDSLVDLGLIDEKQKKIIISNNINQ